MGIVECDDGNRLNGDGCSADCKVERSYECANNGTKYTRDICKRKIPIIGTINVKLGTASISSDTTA